MSLFAEVDRAPGSKIFWRDLSRHGSRPALFDADDHWALGYDALETRVASIASKLRAPVRRLILLISSHDIGAVVCLLGALRAGHAVQILEGSARASSATWLETFGHDLVLARPAPGEDCSAFDPGFLGDLEYGGRDLADPPALHPDLSLLLATSGSTGAPKAVRMSKRALTTSAQQVRQSLGIAPTDVAFLTLPISHVYGLSVLTSHLAAGATVAFSRRSILDPMFPATAAGCGATSFAGVAFTYEQARRLGWERSGLRAFTTLTHSGDALDGELARWLATEAEARGARFYRMYGMTETCGRAAVLAPELFRLHPDAVGAAVAGGRLAIDADGSVVYRGRNVMMGYAHTREDLTRGDDCGGEFTTGDIGALEDGLLTLRGRKTRLAKILGLRFDLDDVERCFRALGQTAAIERQGRIVVFLEAPQGAVPSQLLEQAVLSAAVPRSALRIFRIDSLPRAQSGKLMRGSLPDGPLPAAQRIV